jgi:hypothetical protein
MVNGALVETGSHRCQLGLATEAEGRNPVTRNTTVTLLTIALLSLLPGCTTKAPLPPGVRASVEVGPPLKSEAWKAVATAADEDRLARLGLAWQEALEDAGKTNAADIRREGKLLLPRSALPRPEPTPGSYNCRLIKLGRATPRSRPYETFKPFFCYVEVEDELLTIVKQTGSQRPAGRLWADDEPTRLVFLGSLALGDETAPIAYGDDPRRDMAGVLERIGPFKWRLVIPWPQSTSKLDVFELTPVAQQPEG